VLERTERRLHGIVAIEMTRVRAQAGLTVCVPAASTVEV